MKSRILTISVLFLFLSVALSAQNTAKKDTALGRWKFEAPYAPEGFTTGTIEFTFADNRHSSSISFTGNDYKIPGDKTKIEKDTVTFSVVVEGNEVAVTLKIESDSKMTGKAVTYDGEIPLTLTREIRNK
ncbi:MAG TPA: hypothetical protein PLX08_08395 [Bacteroidales bacterium]|jgi:hypothetical protein|nr:hypothetical protein [Bacteroidales bacterium]